MPLPNGLEDSMGTTIDGILGYNFLSALTAVIDYSANEISFFPELTRTQIEMYPEPDITVPFSLLFGALVQVQGNVDDGELFPFILDIGARFTVLNPVSAGMSNITFSAVTEDSAQLGLGPEDVTIELGGGTAESLEIGSLYFARPVLRSAALPIFDMLKLNEVPFGILGNDLLSHYKVAVDYQRSEVNFWIPE